MLIHRARSPSGLYAREVQDMRKFMGGVVIGQVLGAVVSAGASGYFSPATIMDKGRTFRRGYAAGIAGTLQTLMTWGDIGKEYLPCSPNSEGLGVALERMERIWTNNPGGGTATSVYLNKCR